MTKKTQIIETYWVMLDKLVILLNDIDRDNVYSWSLQSSKQGYSTDKKMEHETVKEDPCWDCGER